MSIDIVKYMESWAMRWADDRVSSGANNWDWNHTNPVFSKYYDLYGVDLLMTNTDYVITSRETRESNVYSTTYGPNDFDSYFDFTHTYESTDTFTWTLSNTFSSGFETSISVGIPDVFGSEFGTTFTISTQETSTQTSTHTNTWTQNSNVFVEKDVTAEVSMIVSIEDITATSNLIGVATGRVAIGLNSRWNGHYFWFVPVDELARSYNESNDVTVVGNEVHCTAPMEFHGDASVSSHIQIKKGTQKGTQTSQTSFIKHPFENIVGKSPNQESAFDDAAPPIVSNLSALQEKADPIYVMMSKKGTGTEDAKSRKKKRNEP